MRLLLIILLASATTLGAETRGESARVDRELPRIGEGIAVVFSPDLAVSGNREFYETLGFHYVESADWTAVVDDLQRAACEHPIDTVIVESHGANGNGLKLQASLEPAAARSYISVGGLQHALAGSSVREILLSACNAGRLFRPAIYNRLDRFVGDRLFLPATLGFVDAPGDFRPTAFHPRVLRRKESNLETLVEGDWSELPRESLFSEAVRGEKKFVVSTMLIQFLSGDPSLELVDRGFAMTKSRDDLSRAESERLFLGFMKALDERAAELRKQEEAEAAVAPRAAIFAPITAQVATPR